MTEIEKDLSKEIAEKKRTAHSASKRVGKTKKCTLPFELMGKEERKKYMEASAVEVFQLRPMTLKEFQAIPGDKQNELLRWYGEKYGWNPEGVAVGLGTSYATGRKILEKRMMIPMFKARMKACTKEQKAQFIKNRQEVIRERHEPPKESSKQTQPLTPVIEENAPKSNPQPLFEISMNKNEFGAILARRLEGMAHSLDTGEVYCVKLSIIQLGSEQDSQGNVVKP